MAILWTVSHPERLVVAVGQNSVTATDILFCVDGMLKAGVISYRKIYDMTLVAITMPQLDLRAVGKRMAAMADNQGFGPVAIVVSSNGVAGSARHFEETSAAKRPVRIFRDLYAAREWLDEVAPPDRVLRVVRDQLDTTRAIGKAAKTFSIPSKDVGADGRSGSLSVTAPVLPKGRRQSRGIAWRSHGRSRIPSD
jgi:hypothetical protein